MPEVRVEMVTPSLAVGGMERLLVRMAAAFRARGLDVGITALEALGPLADEARGLGIPVTLVTTPGLWTNVRAPGLMAHFAARKLTVAHAHSGTWLKTVRAARAAGVPGVMHTFHGIVQHEPRYVDHIRRIASWGTDDIVAVSESLKSHLVEHSGIPADRIEVIINGVDVTRFAPSGRSPGEDRFTVGHVARLDPIKDQVMLLEAFRLLRATISHARLVIAGDGPMRPMLMQTAERLGVSSAVEFLGEVRDTAPLYAGFDVFALSSISEGTSMSLLEAMASGVPIVATAVGGTPALVRHGELAALVPSGSAGAMADALTALARDPARRRQLADTARQHTLEQYSEGTMLDRYQSRYERHLAAGPA